MSTISKDIQKACLVLKNEFPNMRPISVVDYKNLYVFSVQPIDKKMSEKYFIDLLAVKKGTDKVSGFNPFADDSDAYFNAVETNRITF